MYKTSLPWHLVEKKERESIFIMSDESPDAFPVARIDLNEGRYLDCHRANANYIIMCVNTFDEFWNVAVCIANFLKNPIAVDGSTIAALHYLAGMAEKVLEKAKKYES